MATTAIDAARERVYAAECWLHTARQSGIDGWVAQAGDLLHRAVIDYEAVLASATVAA